MYDLQTIKKRNGTPAGFVHRPVLVRDDKWYLEEPDGSLAPYPHANIQADQVNQKAILALA